MRSVKVTHFAPRITLLNLDRFKDELITFWWYGQKVKVRHAGLFSKKFRNIVQWVHIWRSGSNKGTIETMGIPKDARLYRP